MKVLLIGYGKIGKIIHNLIKEEVVGIISHQTVIKNEPDIIIDFSHNDLLEKTIYYSKKYNVPILIGTTGYNEEKMALIREYSNYVHIFISENFSLGVFMIKRFLNLNIKECELYKKVIVETHNKGKKDCPSGTAISLSKSLNTNNIVSKRVADDITTHDIILANDYEQIKISHNVFNREIFAKGALECAAWLLKQKSGLYTMEDYFYEL